MIVTCFCCAVSSFWRKQVQIKAQTGKAMEINDWQKPTALVFASVFHCLCLWPSFCIISQWYDLIWTYKKETRPKPWNHGRGIKLKKRTKTVKVCKRLLHNSVIMFDGFELWKTSVTNSNQWTSPLHLPIAPAQQRSHEPETHPALLLLHKVVTSKGNEIPESHRKSKLFKLN